MLVTASEAGAALFFAIYAATLLWALPRAKARHLARKRARRLRRWDVRHEALFPGEVPLRPRPRCTMGGDYHLRTVPVESVGEVVAYLCLDCDAQLSENWARGPHMVAGWAGRRGWQS